MKFKFKKGSCYRKHSEIVENITDRIYDKLGRNTYSKKKKCYVDELQEDVTVEVNIKIKKAGNNKWQIMNLILC